MNASRYIGRIGGLAVALGVGAAVFTNYGIASAQPASSNSSGSSASGSGTSGRVGLRIAEDTNGFFYQQEDLDRVGIGRRLNVNRRYDVAWSRPGRDIGQQRQTQDVGGHPRWPPLQHHAAAISIGDRQARIDVSNVVRGQHRKLDREYGQHDGGGRDTAAQEGPVVVDANRRNPRLTGLFPGGDEQRHRRNQQGREEEVVNRDFVTGPERRAAKNRHDGFHAVVGVNQEECPGNAERDGHESASNPRCRDTCPHCLDRPCQVDQQHIAPVRREHAALSAGGPARHMDAGCGGAAPGTFRCHRQS